MIVLGTALAAACLLVVAVASLRMLATTGLEDVEASMRTQVDEVAEAKGLGPLLDRLGSRLQGTVMRWYGAQRLERLDVALRRAGRPEGLTVTAYVRRQAGFGVFGLVAVLVFLLLGQLWIGIAFAALFVAWMPLWLRAVGSRRQARVESDLPDFLDVLGVTVMAGLGFRQAVERVCAFHDGPLAEEMTTALREMSLGASRRQAFTALRDRSRSDAVGSFVTALLQAEELGVPLARALEDIARDSRRQRAQQVRQEAAKAGPKISLVITATVVPGALLLLTSSIILANMDTLGDVF